MTVAVNVKTKTGKVKTFRLPINNSIIIMYLIVVNCMVNILGSDTTADC